MNTYNCLLYHHGGCSQLAQEAAPLQTLGLWTLVRFLSHYQYMCFRRFNLTFDGVESLCSRVFLHHKHDSSISVMHWAQGKAVQLGFGLIHFL